MARRKTTGRGFKKQQLGGAWEGGKRKAVKKGYGPGELQYARKRKGGPGAIVTDIVFTLLVLVFFALGFTLVTAYLGSAVGKGWLLAVLSFLLAICAPVALALWAVRPMEGRRAYRWWLGVFGAPFVLATVGLALAVPKRTSFVLHYYGAWIPELVAGKDSKAASNMREVLNKVADIFHAIPDAPAEKKGKDVDVARPRARKPDLRKLAYSGRRWTQSRKIDLTDDQGRRRGVRVSYRRRGGAIIVRGRAGSRRKAVTLILDTGATLTAISPETAVRLGLKPPQGAPMVEVRTASGPAKYPAAVLDKLSLGRAKVKNITVLICGPCAHEGLSGLLGLNFIRHFVLTIDEKRSRLTFTSRKHVVNRAADVEPFLTFAKVKGEERRGVFRVEGKVENKAKLPINSLVLEAVLLDVDQKVLKRLKTTIKKLKPADTAAFVIEGKGHPSTDTFRVEVSQARW